MTLQNWADLLKNPAVYLEITWNNVVTFDEDGVIFESYQMYDGNKTEDLVQWSDYQ